MINKVIDTVKKHNMLSDGDRVVVAVSGGADSMALLTILLELQSKLGISVEAAHVEHGIRGDESLADARFVTAFCADRGVKLHSISINAPVEANENGMSVEEYSRKRRYEFFDSLECDKIATAHNLTDNIETLLFRLARGTGVKGACGIPYVRGRIIRPLLDITSEEIRDYCKSYGIDFRIDSTNAKSEYSRNNIRNNVLPVLKEINPSYEQMFAGFLSDINSDNRYFENKANELLDSLCVENMLDTQALKSLDRSLRARVIIAYAERNSVTLDRRHMEDIISLLDTNGRCQIRGDIYALCDKKHLRIAELGSQSFSDNYIVKILNIDEFHREDIDFYCDYDKIIGSVTIGSREEGDYIRPANRGCGKTVKKLLNELSVPAEKRGTLPVIRDDNGVIGIVGICADERVKADSGTQRFYTITLPTED